MCWCGLRTGQKEYNPTGGPIARSTMNCVMTSASQFLSPQFSFCSSGSQFSARTVPVRLEKLPARRYRSCSMSCSSNDNSKNVQAVRSASTLVPEDLISSSVSFRQSCFRLGAKAAVVTVLAATIMQSDVASAYIGGGPYGRMVTRGQDLTGKDFSRLDLTQQDFKTSILRQANFHGSKLLGASFFDADLTGADLSDSDLRGADFSLTNAQKANFTNAIFEGATVTGNTSFKNAVITGADFTDVLFREDQLNLLCKTASGTNPVTGNVTRETLFCR